MNLSSGNDGADGPVLGPTRDTYALDLSDALLPGVTVVGIPAREILLGGGNIHCITQPVPATSR